MEKTTVISPAASLEFIVLVELTKNPYGMTAATLVHETKVTKPKVLATLARLIASKKVVTMKTGRNAPMFSLPNTCLWSRTAATLAGVA